MHASVFLNVIIAIPLFASNAVEAETLWVVANRGESQARTCARSGHAVTDSDVSIQWNASVVKSVVDILGRNFSSKATESGLYSCCVSGLWCDETGCYTGGFSDNFQNYGWLNDKTAVPIYTCSSATASVSDITVTATSLTPAGLTIQGTNFGSPQSVVDVNINGETCANVEVVNVLNSCPNPVCPLGSLCIYNGQSHRCYISCANALDRSCPSDFTCREVALSLSAAIFLCTTDSKIYYSPNSYDVLTCSATRAYQEQYELNDAPYNYSLQSEAEVFIDVSSETPQYAAWCKTDSDCYDGDICTSDSCNSGTGFCVFEDMIMTGCSSTLLGTQERRSPYMYLSYELPPLPADEISSFVDKLKSRGTLSTASGSDDAPSEPLVMPFNFTFFGNVVQEFSVNPDGFLMLPPRQSCSVSGEKCIAFSSSANIIAPWLHDWDPASSAVSSIWTYRQAKGDKLQIFGTDADAVHTLFYQLQSYSKNGVSRPNSTFAASIYSDSSLRFTYLSSLEVDRRSSGALFNGLWGSFASTNPSPPSFGRYHTENISSSLSTMNYTGGESVSVAFCAIEAIGCLQKACLAAQDTLAIEWKGNLACAAAGSALSASCSWLGGAVVTAATIKSTNGHSTLSCEVPMLDLPDDFVTEVGIILGTGTGNSTISQNSRFFGVSIGANQELARTNLMVRYFGANSSETASCGCSAMQGFEGHTCDVYGVCGGADDSTVCDCAGTAFGSAYKDMCSQCSGGSTGMTPSLSHDCEDYLYESDPLLNLISQTVILLMIICCMTFVTSTVSYSIRRIMGRPPTRDRDDNLFETQMALQLLAAGGLNRISRRGASNGLSDIECEALGVMIFSEELRETISKKGANSADSSPENTSDTGVINFSNDLEENTDAAVKTDGSIDCSICLGEVELGQQCRMLPDPCGHLFHQECIDEWLKQSVFCPLCKRSVRAALFGEDSQLPMPTDTFALQRVYTSADIHFASWARGRLDMHNALDAPAFRRAYSVPTRAPVSYFAAVPSTAPEESTPRASSSSER